MDSLGSRVLGAESHVYALPRFPEVPQDLRDEPVLAEFVRAFGSQLRVESPQSLSADHDACVPPRSVSRRHTGRFRI